MLAIVEERILGMWAPVPPATQTRGKLNMAGSAVSRLLVSIPGRVEKQNGANWLQPAGTACQRPELEQAGMIVMNWEGLPCLSPKHQANIQNNKKRLSK